MNEEWRPISEYENLYEVSNKGRTKRLARDIIRKDGAASSVPETILSITPNTRTSYIVLRKDGKPKNHSIIRLVAKAFIPEFAPKDVIAKIDKKLGNNLENIKISSRKEIMTEAWASKDSYVKDGRCHSKLKEDFLDREKIYKEIPSLIGEIWVSVTGFEKYYLISNFGRLKRLSRKIILKDCRVKIFPDRISTPKINTKNKYPNFTMVGDDKIQESHPVHRLVATAFIPNPENKPYINHKNGIKPDFRIENLEWVTGSENIIHALETGLKKVKIGEAAPNIKTTNEELNEILRLRDSGLSNTEVGEISGVGRKYVERMFRMRKNGLDLSKRRTFRKSMKSNNIQYITEKTN